MLVHGLVEEIHVIWKNTFLFKLKTPRCRDPRVQACGFRAHRVNPAEDEAGGPVGIAQAFNVIINNSIFMVLSDICQ